MRFALKFKQAAAAAVAAAAAAAAAAATTTTTTTTMRLIIENDGGTVAETAANYIRKRILDFAPTAERPFVLGLPTGR